MTDIKITVPQPTFKGDMASQFNKNRLVLYDVHNILINESQIEVCVGLDNIFL